jgi:hypothetical protein
MPLSEVENGGWWRNALDSVTARRGGAVVDKYEWQSVSGDQLRRLSDSSFTPKAERSEIPRFGYFMTTTLPSLLCHVPFQRTEGNATRNRDFRSRTRLKFLGRARPASRFGLFPPASSSTILMHFRTSKPRPSLACRRARLRMGKCSFPSSSTRSWLRESKSAGRSPCATRLSAAASCLRLTSASMPFVPVTRGPKTPLLSPVAGFGQRRNFAVANWAEGDTLRADQGAGRARDLRDFWLVWSRCHGTVEIRLPMWPSRSWGLGWLSSCVLGRPLFSSGDRGSVTRKARNG